MIELKTLEACENCKMFIPTLADDLILTTLKGEVCHTVTCEYIERCRMLLKNLEERRQSR